MMSSSAPDVPSEGSAPPLSSLLAILKGWEGALARTLQDSPQDDSAQQLYPFVYLWQQELARQTLLQLAAKEESGEDEAYEPPVYLRLWADYDPATYGALASFVLSGQDLIEYVRHLAPRVLQYLDDATELSDSLRTGAAYIALHDFCARVLGEGDAFPQRETAAQLQASRCALWAILHQNSPVLRKLHLDNVLELRADIPEIAAVRAVLPGKQANPAFYPDTTLYACTAALRKASDYAEFHGHEAEKHDLPGRVNISPAAASLADVRLLQDRGKLTVFQAHYTRAQFYELLSMRGYARLRGDTQPSLEEARQERDLILKAFSHAQQDAATRRAATAAPKPI